MNGSRVIGGMVYSGGDAMRVMKLAISIQEENKRVVAPLGGCRVYPSHKKALRSADKGLLATLINDELNCDDSILLVTNDSEIASLCGITAYDSIYTELTKICDAIELKPIDKIIIISDSTYDFFYIVSGTREKSIKVCSIIDYTDAYELSSCLSKLPEECIYPCDIPVMTYGNEDAKNLYLIDTPARNLALMPNGFGYVHESLLRLGITHTVIDFDIILYHWFQINRIIDNDGELFVSDDLAFPADPWKADHYDLWTDDLTVEFFRKYAKGLADFIARDNPKVIMLSLQQNNEAFNRILVEEVRKVHSDVIVTVGGFSCYNQEIGLRAFPQADYMFIGESDFTIDLLIPRLLKGEKPGNISGVLSKFDDESVPYKAQPLAHELDIIPFPKYEWYDIDTYRNWNGYQLTPVIASRGCRWARCTFCAERFYWRIRSAKNFVDELEWLVKKGCTLFMFNESDLNGAPERLLEICDELIERKLKVRLTGQLRIHVKSNKRFFQKLAKAGFTTLRFGVDAFSDHAMKLQVKGYNSETVYQNLKDCWEAGIYTEVNWVIGVPGETWDDVEEGIRLAIKCKPYIGRMANINALMLLNGSVYWQNPDAHNIVFHECKEELFRKYPRVVPSEYWHSENPYIDSQVRRAYFEHIVLQLSEEGFQFGEWASEIVRKFKSGIELADRVGQKG